MITAEDIMSKRNILELLVLGQQSVECFHQLAEIQKFHKHIASVKYKQIIIGNHVENTINLIIKHRFLLTTSIIIIVMIDEHNKILPKMIMIRRKWEKWQYSQLNTYTGQKKPIVSLGNDHYAIKKNPTGSSTTYLMTG